MFETATRPVDDDVFDKALDTDSPEKLNSIFGVIGENNLKDTSTIFPLSKTNTITFGMDFQEREPPPVDSFAENDIPDKDSGGFGMFTDATITNEKQDDDFGDFTNFSNTNGDQAITQEKTELPENTFSSFASFSSTVSGADISFGKDKYSVFSEITSNQFTSSISNKTEDVGLVDTQSNTSTTSGVISLNSNINSVILPTDADKTPDTITTSNQINDDDLNQFAEFSSFPCEKPIENSNVSLAPVDVAPKIVSNFEFEELSDNAPTSVHNPTFSILATTNPSNDFGSFSTVMQDGTGFSDKQVHETQSEAVRPHIINPTETYGDFGLFSSKNSTVINTDAPSNMAIPSSIQPQFDANKSQGFIDSSGLLNASTSDSFADFSSPIAAYTNFPCVLPPPLSEPLSSKTFNSTPVIGNTTVASQFADFSTNENDKSNFADFTSHTSAPVTTEDFGNFSYFPEGMDKAENKLNEVPQADIASSNTLINENKYDMFKKSTEIPSKANQFITSSNDAGNSDFGDFTAGELTSEFGTFQDTLSDSSRQIKEPVPLTLEPQLLKPNSSNEIQQSSNDKYAVFASLNNSDTNRLSVNSQSDVPVSSQNEQPSHTDAIANLEIHHF